MNVSFHLGDQRAVIAIPALGIVLKFPRVRLHDLARVTRSHFKRKRVFHKNLVTFLQNAYRWNTEVYGSPQRLLFKGFVDNWREWQFSRDFGHPVLARTYVYMAVVNVQAYAAPLPDQDRSRLWRRFASILGKGIFRDGHHFDNPQNFGVRDGHVVVVDYAGQKVQIILRESADRLLREFPLK